MPDSTVRRECQFRPHVAKGVRRRRFLVVAGVTMGSLGLIGCGGAADDPHAPPTPYSFPGAKPGNKDTAKFGCNKPC
jgi:hypothetical protein